jgi:hypothetical protein
MLYIVIQKPRLRYRHSFSTGYAIVEAKSKAQARFIACQNHSDYIGGSTADFLPPEAQPLREGIRGYI